MLSETLISFLKQDCREKMITVVDNDIKSPFEEGFAKSFPEVHFLRADQNRGWAAACNLAMKNINPDKKDIILLSNNDVVLPDAGILTKMIQKYYVDGETECIAGTAVNYYDDPERKHNQGWILFENKEIPFNRTREDYTGAFCSEKTDYISGCFMMFPFGITDRIGFPDESFFMYAEDADYCYNAWKNGIPVFCNPDVQVLHHVGGEKGPVSPFREYYLSRNIYLFLEKQRDHLNYSFFEKYQRRKDRRRILGMFFGGTGWNIRSAVLDGIRDGRKGIKGLVREP